MTQIVLTSGTSWTVPSDWNDYENTIEAIGGGGSGQQGNGGVGGGGGAYAKITNWTGTRGNPVSIQVGVGGVDSGTVTTPTNTWFDSTSVLDAGAGQNGRDGGAGGTVNAGTGSGGGSGGSGSAIAAGGGGAGAGGPGGAGGNGGVVTSGVGFTTSYGSGGGGGNGGANGSPATPSGVGAGGAGGTGGGATGGDGGQGSFGSGVSDPGGGGVWSGGGGGSAALTGTEQVAGGGGLYGGGGGGGGGNNNFQSHTGPGGGGAIIITYGLGSFTLSGPIRYNLTPGETSPPGIVTVQSVDGFNNAVTLSVFSEPSGITASFGTSPVTPPANGSVTSNLTVTIGSNVVPGTYTLVIQGVSGSETEKLSIAIDVYILPVTGEPSPTCC